MYLPENAKEMFRKLVELARRLGRDPTFDEVRDEPGMPHPNDFAFYFGSFTEAKKEAHRVAFVYTHEPRWMQPQEGTYIRVEEEQSMSRKVWTDEELIQNLLELWDKLGHFPNTTDVNIDKNCASVITYINRFKVQNWKEVQEYITQKRNAVDNANDTPIEQEPKPESKPEPASVGPASEPTQGGGEEMGLSKEEFAERMLSDKIDAAPEPESQIMATELIPPAEIIEDEVKLISLLPRTIVVGVTVAGYASVLRMHDSMPVFRSIAGIPICKEFEILQILMNGKQQSFPEPSDGVYYIVERQVAMSAKLCGRPTDDLLIPKKFTKEGSVMTIAEFTTL